jgi:phenylacetic acid degradation operon negative regulatory protein
LSYSRVAALFSTAEPSLQQPEDFAGRGTAGPSGAVPRPTPRHQQLIVTIYGLYGRPNGGVVPVSVLISMLDDLGVESSGARDSSSATP